MTLNAFIGRLRNNVCLCSIINVSMIKTKALLTSIAMNQTCIGTRETDDLRSQLMRRTKPLDRKSTRLNSSHLVISYAVFCLKKKKNHTQWYRPLQSQHNPPRHLCKHRQH